MLVNTVLAFLVTTASPHNLPRPPPEQIKTSVMALGDSSTWEDLDALERKFGCAAVPVLVDELRAVSVTGLAYRSKNREAEHVAWVIAALRYISGQEFTGTVSKSDLKHHSERARYFLTLSTPPGEARIVSLWPSRGTLYFGPTNTQLRVIEKWRAFSRSGKCRPSDWGGRKLGGFFLGGSRD
jgi:hypothetical protein